MPSEFKTEDLDGSLFTAIQGDIGEKGILHLKYEDRIITFDPELLAYPLRENRTMQAVLGKDVPPLLSKVAAPLLRWVFKNNAYKDLYRAHKVGLANLPDRARQVLIEGKLSFDATINSRGGNAMTSRAYVGAIEAVKNRGGQTSTYGLNAVGSGAAATWQEAEHRFGIDKGFGYLWHRGASRAGNMKLWQAYEEDHHEERTREFFSGARDGKEKEAVLNNLAQNKDGEVHLSARELERLGLIKRVVKMEAILDEIPKHSTWTRAEIVKIIRESL